MREILRSPNATKVAMIGGLGGFLIGYNTAVISGVLLVLKELFAINTIRQANIVSILLFGALFGAVLAGFFSDKFGRKKTLVATMIAYAVGALIMMVSHAYWLFALGRFVTGIGIGLGVFAIPLYVAEISPPKRRGMLIAINQLAVAVGIFFAYLINFIVDADMNFRIVFAFSFLFALIEMGLVMFIPESPSWLLAMTKRKEARAVIRQVRPEEDADKVIAQIEKHLMNATKDYFMKKVIVPSVIAGLVLSVMHQLVGATAAISYAPSILQQSGFFFIRTATEAAVAIGVFYVLSTIAAFYLIDRIGRKPLLMSGLAVMAFALVLLSVTHFFAVPYLSAFTLIGLILWVSAFALSLGAVVWVLIAEIFPMAVRGKVVALCVFVNFLMNYIISSAFLPLYQKASPAFCFFLFFLFTLASIYYVWKSVPETQHKSLEDIEKFWKK
jgi:sugar porter (SP) family MFS transporter